MMVETDKKQQKQSVLNPWQFQPGKSGNPAGRPCGSKNKATIAAEIGAETLERIEAMSKPELVNYIIKRVPGAVLRVACMTEEETYQAMLHKLAVGGLTSDDARDTLNYIREWIDRKKGKPVGTAPNINIGAGSGEKKIQIVFMNADDVRREREEKERMKVIEG